MTAKVAADRTVASRAEYSPILAALQNIHAKYKSDFSGEVAGYIPELAKTDPGLFGVALASADGQIYEVGDANRLFTIQSISKPFVYGLALEDHGVDYVLSKVGVEPTGEAFNSIVFDERHNRPFNPMVNAGAIATTALVKGVGHEQRLARLLAKFGAFIGRTVEIDHAVYLSERSTGHRNRAIGYLELNFGMIDERVEEHLDLYFEQCSIMVSARDLAVMTATLANNGVNPLTGKRALDARYVQHVLSVMHSCGMYDYAGEWNYRIGLPAKSGVGGGIVAVLPGQFGLGTFSPLLDEQGNSRRGIQVCEELSEQFKLHMFRSRAGAGVVVRRSYRCATVRSKRLRSKIEEAILNRNGGALCVHELQGNLFFGSMERLLRKIAGEIESVSHVVLDFKRVTGADECAYSLLAQMNALLTKHGRKLLFSHFPECLTAALRGQAGGEWLCGASFPDTDAALEWCENDLIRSDPSYATAEQIPVPLGRMEIITGLDVRQVKLLESIIEERRYAAGETIVREGEAADAIYLLAEGIVSVRLKLDNRSGQRRLSTLAPGLAFGELALLDGGRRSADVIADEAALCYVLPIAKLNALAGEEPEIRTQLVINIGRELSARLRRADAEIRSLAE